MKPYIAVNLTSGSWHVEVRFWEDLKSAYLEEREGPVELVDVHGGIVLDRYENIESLWLATPEALARIEEEEEDENKRAVIYGK